MILVLVLVCFTLLGQGKTKLQQYKVHTEAISGIREKTCWKGGISLPCERLDNALEESNYTSESIITIILPMYQREAYNCPTWMHHINDTSKCACGINYHHIVKCNSTLNQVYVLDCYQMTFDEELQQVLVGPSIYGCDYNHHDKSKVYRLVPMNKSQINVAMCGPFNRSGRLCGACKDGHSPIIYSYDRNCMQCSDFESRYNWAKFVAFSFIPLTTFYIFVVIVQFNANSPSLHGFILAAQVISMPDLIRVCMGISNERAALAVKVIATIYGVWNLDFFRAFSPNICLNISTLQALALDYVIAFYPLLLMSVTYISIKLHSKGYKIFVWLWRPFRRCYANIA